VARFVHTPKADFSLTKLNLLESMDDHIPTDRMIVLVQGEDAFTREESGHFRTCRVCRDAIERVDKELRQRSNGPHSIVTRQPSEEI